MYRILIVDDEKMVRDLLVKNIGTLDLNVEVAAAAENGRDAWKLAQEIHPDIVITDIAMPFMNGLELIKKMKEAGITSKNIVISGYDEFNYARQAIALGVQNYLLKPFLPKDIKAELEKIIKELDSQQALQQNMNMLQKRAQSHTLLAKEKAIRALLDGSTIETEDSEFDIFSNCIQYLAGIIDITNDVWKFEKQENVEEFLELVKNGYFSGNISMHAVSLEHSRIAIVWGTKDASSNLFLQKVKQGIIRLRESVMKYYKASVTAALGSPCSDMSQIVQSYQEALSAWRGNLIQSGDVIVFDKNKAVQQKKEVEVGNIIREQKSRIRLYIHNGQLPNALESLQSLIKAYASLSDKKNDYISVSVEELIYDIQNDMEQAGLMKDAAMQNFSKRSLRYGSLMDMKELLENVIRNCCKVVEEHSEETKVERSVNEIKTLIDTNLSYAGMDLEWIASQVHFSMSYVRQIFKQVMKENVNEYIIRKRMEQAGILLQKGGLRIQEIATKCGYEDQRYFASSFKKFYGCTPSEFKKAVENEHLY